jgi:hypothetical protein
MNTFALRSGTTARHIPPEVKALLRALQLSNPEMTRLKKLSNEEWASLLTFSDLAHLTLPIAQLPMDGFPDWVVERLRCNLADNALRYERIKATYREAADALDRAGVEHLVIKGFTQSPDYVPDPRFRAQSDIDIFCPLESVGAARDALFTIGYKPSDAKVSYARADHQEPMIRPGDWQWRGNPFDPEMPLGIELHFCLWNEKVSHIRIPEIELFWARRTVRMVSGFSFSCLSLVDHLAYFALHILRNLFIRDWIIHHVFELAVFLHSHAEDDSFWQLWHESHSPALRSYQAIAFYHAHSWFDCRLHPLAAHEIDRIPASRQSWLLRFSDSALESMFLPNKDSLWLHLSFFTSPWDKWKLLRQVLLPRQIGSIRSPAVQMLGNKRITQPFGRPLWVQYIAYLFNRSVNYGRTGLVVLWRGLCWNLSRV